MSAWSESKSKQSEKEMDLHYTLPTYLINTLQCNKWMNDLIYNKKIKQHLKRIANTCSGSRNKKNFDHKTIMCPFCLNKPNNFFCQYALMYKT